MARAAKPLGALQDSRGSLMIFQLSTILAPAMEQSPSVEAAQAETPLDMAKNPAEVAAAQVQEFLEVFRWEGMLASVFVIFGAWILLLFLRQSVEALSETFTTRRLIFQRVQAFVHLGVNAMTILAVILLSFKISPQIMVAIGGSLAVAIGFATKDLVGSIVGGILILFDRPFQVGDRIEFGGNYGDVTKIGLRSVQLQTLDDNTITIPNNKFLTDISSSGNYGELDMQVSATFYIGLDQNAQLATELVEEATATSRFIHLPRPIVVLVDQVIVESYIALRLTMKAYVLDTQYEKAFGTDITLRVMDAFREHGIHPPAVLHRGAELEIPRGAPQEVES